MSETFVYLHIHTQDKPNQPCLNLYRSVCLFIYLCLSVPLVDGVFYSFHVETDVPNSMKLCKHIVVKPKFINRPATVYFCTPFLDGESELNLRS